MRGFPAGDVVGPWALRAHLLPTSHPPGVLVFSVIFCLFHLSVSSSLLLEPPPVPRHPCNRGGFLRPTSACKNL